MSLGHPLGLVKAKPREEQLEENFRAWLVTKNLTSQQAGYLHLLKNRGLARGQIEVADLFRPPLSALNAAALGVEYFGETGLKAIIQDLRAAFLCCAVCAWSWIAI